MRSAIAGNALAAGNEVIFAVLPKAGQFVRPAGLDFREGDLLLDAGRRVGPREIALAAAGNHPALPVRRRPDVTILATGDELVAPGGDLAPGVIVDAVSAALAALAARAGASALAAGIIRDDDDALTAALAIAARTSDVVVTVGGASVGDHDRIRAVLDALGFSLEFWRIAMRPGRPLFFARRGAVRVLGLPGNPVSALVTATLFLVPLVAALLGESRADPAENAILGAEMAANDGRQDYVRARLAPPADGTGLPVATPFQRQDSSMLATLAAADCLVIRAPDAPAAPAGAPCRIIRLR